MKRIMAVICFILADLTVFAGIGNLVIRDFYGFKPEAWFILFILAISSLFIWAGSSLWRKSK